MKLLRNVFSGLLFAVLAGIALPASAAKIYAMTVQLTSPTTVAVKITNVTPENNSTINSFIINKPYAGAVLSPLSSSDPATVVQDGNGNVRVNGFNGLKSAGKNPNNITINLTVNWGGAGTPTCASAVNWTAVVYTGNFSSTTFQLVDANGNPVSSVPLSLNCYTLTGLPAIVEAGTSKIYSATLTNTSGAASITALTVAASTTGIAATVAPLSPPVAPGASRSVNVTVNAACGVSAGSWSSAATGSGSATFTGATSSPTYGVSPCTVTFNPGPPASIGNNVDIAPAVTVSAKNGAGVALPWNGSVTWSLTSLTPGGTGSVNNPAGVCVDTGTCSIWSFPTLQITGTIGASFQLTATTTLGSVVANTSTTSGAFKIFGGTLGCVEPLTKAGDLDPGLDAAYVMASQQGKWGLIRGSNKPGGDVCIPVPYTFTLDIFANPQQASFIVPTDPPFGSQKVAVQYVVVWGRVAVNPATFADPSLALWTTKRPNVSWGFAAPVPGTDQYVPALACVLDPDDFPGVTSANLESLLPIIPNVPPFSTSPHAQYQPDGVKRAKMCIAQQGWTAVGTDPLTGLTLLQYWTKAIDQSDGFMSLDN